VFVNIIGTTEAYLKTERCGRGPSRFFDHRRWMKAASRSLSMRGSDVATICFAGNHPSANAIKMKTKVLSSLGVAGKNRDHAGVGAWITASLFPSGRSGGHLETPHH